MPEDRAVVSTIALERYIAAFETWAHVANQGTASMQSIARVAEYLRARYRGDVEIETLCNDGMAWLRAQRLPVPDVGKSCLMGRLIYGGEELRTRPCPVHHGHWSGCSPELCPGGCNYGINWTGWLPNDLVDEWPAQADDAALAALADSVRETWSPDHLAVYADRLIALGDPRGELITLELAMGDAPTAEQRVRHDALTAACFGDIRSTAQDEFRSTRGIGTRASVELGFLAVDAREPSDLRKVYNARNGRYLRKLAIRGDSRVCCDSLCVLSIRPHAWLDRLTVIQEPVPRHPFTLEAPAARALFAATPCLSALEVTGRRVIAVDELPVAWLWMSEVDTVSFQHAPRLTTLVLSVDKVDDGFPVIIGELVRRAPALESIHVPARAVAGIALDHPKIRVV